MKHHGNINIVEGEVVEIVRIISSIIGASLGKISFKGEFEHLAATKIDHGTYAGSKSPFVKPLEFVAFYLRCRKSYSGIGVNDLIVAVALAK